MKIIEEEGRRDEHKEKANLRTINGVKKMNGMVKLKIKMYNIEEIMNIFIEGHKNLNNNFLIGLDCIKKFKLFQD